MRSYSETLRAVMGFLKAVQNQTISIAFGVWLYFIAVLFACSCFHIRLLAEETVCLLRLLFRGRRGAAAPINLAHAAL